MDYEEDPVADSLDDLATQVGACFISPNVEDSNGESANVVDAIASIAQSLRIGLDRLGTNGAGTSMGAIEAHGAAVIESADKIALAINDLAEAIREFKRT